MKQVVLALAFSTFALTTAAAPAQLSEKLTPDWIVDRSTGCRIWNPAPQPNETITWSGPCPGGIATGRGVLQWYEDGKPRNRYDGAVRDGKYDGWGVAVYTNGGRYEGDFVDGKLTGRGSYAWANGDRYEGDFVDGKLHGRGTLRDKYSTYDGEWRDNIEHGKGVLVWASGAHYDGDWVDGQRIGQGTFVWADGAHYIGHYNDSRPDGFGGYFTADRKKYSGIWSDGCFRDGDKRAAIGRDLDTCP